MKKTSQEVKLNILNTVIAIAERSKDSKLQRAVINRFKSKIKFFAEYLNTTDNQAFILANIFALNYDKNEVDIDDMARYFDCTPLKLLNYKDDIDELVKRKMLVRTRKRHGIDIALGKYEFVISESVSEAILDNKPIGDIKISSNFNMFDLLEIVHRKAELREDKEITTRELFAELEYLMNMHKELPFVKTIDQMKLNRESLGAFLYLCSEAVDCGNNGEDLDRLASKIFDNNRDKYRFMRDINSKRIDLFEKRLVRLASANFRGNIEVYLTDHILDILFEDNAQFFKEKLVDNKKLKKVSEIPKKQLFYNEKDNKSISFLADSLGKRNFKALQKRLQSNKLPIGVNVLFYGYPGTGKTETALQLAKQTGRDIMQVDISDSKSMWFGESEKRIKQIFSDYKEACKTSKTTPILLFNEADAILGKRKVGSNSNVAQTENAMQNILLEEMENMQGILIATTNLKDNLDSAFDRRFLHKIEFHKPDTKAMVKIWQSKLKGYKKHEYEVLAENFNLSGGQIDNVVRKATMQEVMYNTKTDLEVLFSYCLEESDYRNNKNTKVGF